MRNVKCQRDFAWRTVMLNRAMGRAPGKHNPWLRQLLACRRPGMTLAEEVVVVIALGILLLIAFAMVASPFGQRSLSGRAICSVNIRSLIQSMIIYAQDNNNAQVT